MHYKNPKDRNELLLYPNIELWVEQNSPVRLIDLVVEKLLLKMKMLVHGEAIVIKAVLVTRHQQCSNY